MSAVIFSRLRVLIVDDEILMRTFVCELLRQLGVHQIHEATDGKAALVEAIRFQPDLVLCDIHMEPVGGLDFVRQLRALPNSLIARLPVIMMTADQTKETLREALPLGIKGYIIKPPGLEAMKQRIRAALQ